ncbi:MAG TPA: hypothetical protein VMD30_14285 [Tepidisphaeraceae bacterium]|nr:hypothetical protein [Tepidisphaeraceae bacterium]
MKITQSNYLAGFALLALLFVPACKPQEATSSDSGTDIKSTDVASDGPTSSGDIALEQIDLNDPVSPLPIEGAVSLTAAKNEWTSFVVRLAGLPAPNGVTRLTLTTGSLAQPNSNATIPPDSFSFYEILPMPVDGNRAGFVRHTGLSAAMRQLPRALLPLAGAHGTLDTDLLRDPAHGRDPHSQAGGDSQPPLIWIDLHVPQDAAAGQYSGDLSVAQNGADHPLATLPIQLTVFNFTISPQRHLQMVGEANWQTLRRLYTNQTEAITPRLINRTDPTYSDIVSVMDALVGDAHANRANLFIEGLQPTVKWIPAEPPNIDWSDYDSLVSPWLSGDGFADHIGVGYWPIPDIDYLENYDPASRQEYWSLAAEHFSQNGWLSRSSVFLRRPDSAEQDASLVLASHPLVRVTVPMDDQALLQSAIDPQTFDRIDAASPGLVYVAPSHPWPAGAAMPRHWMRTDLPGLVPYVGAGADEVDVRLWAWLAFLRHADLILWTGTLPDQNDPAAPADPNALTWFYPGSWFGVDQPVPSIQLKWLRRAQEDYEYLWLANQRNQELNALIMARLITKQVELDAHQEPDPVYALLSGTTQPEVWDEARELLARTILLGDPDIVPTDAASQALSIAMQEWQGPKERPFLIPRSVDWAIDPQHDGQLDVSVGIDVYNASDRAGQSPNEPNEISWISAGGGWQFSPQPTDVPPLRTYHVQRFTLQSSYDLSQGPAPAGVPLMVQYEDGFTHNDYTSQIMLPVAASDRREGGVTIDGKLNDWFDADLIENGRLVRALDRPTLQKQTVAYAAQPARIFTAWGDEDFYVAFRLQGLGDEPSTVSNQVDYQYRRAWGDDLCEILIQPLYDDNSLGPVLHVVCKPNGPTVERRLPDGAWAAFDGSPIRYAATLDWKSGQWDGEVAIPWSALMSPGKPRPHLLRFNFIQHTAKTGETASWAGPIDFGRDDQFMGLIFLRQPPPFGPGQ